MGTAGATLSGKAAIHDLAERFARVYATFRGAEEVFSPDVLFDINIPTWRFQVRGPGAFGDWLREYSPSGYRIDLRGVVPTASGFAAEIEGDYSPHGERTTFRNLVLCEVRDGLITEVVYFCTGDWDPETQRRHRAEVALIRP